MILLLLIVSLVGYSICRAIYNITLHPLAAHPGPKLWAAFQFPYVYHVFRGRLPDVVKELHDKYGPIVRIAPHELSFISAQAWRDIHGARNPQNPKDQHTYLPPDEYEGKRMIQEVNDAKHKAARDQISHAFAPKALLEHQPLVTKYVDQLISSIRSKIPENKPLDLTSYFNWTTFDIIGHLTFGESFHCLDTFSTHPWIKVIFDGVLAGQILNQLARYHLLTPVMKLIPQSMQKPRDDMIAFSNEMMDARIKQGFGPGTRQDFAYFMRNGPHGTKPADIEVMSRDVMCANGETLIIAGSETTATLLAGTTFLLLSKRPDYLARMQHEIRTAFADDSLDSINFKTTTEKLPLTIAALREGLRYYPPIPFGIARRIVDQPKMVDGHLIPVNTSVSISQLAAHRSESNFFHADGFLPERWLEDATRPGSPYADDHRDSCQPYSVGPRSCLGKPLAEMEMRIIYAKLIYNFDFELVAGQDDWIDKQTQSLIRGKGPLMVQLTDIRA